ncbi:uncharacterized protein L199_002000 [Kwoniella botswanensis]|uniref:uncharacterized protein n=1 Tax=Kwoniella botswanensis TaxID=1268659 RepID=UPI00315D7A49
MGLNSPLPVRLEEETRKAAKILKSFVDVNNNGLDKVIPRQVLERAAGFAIFTVFKAGFVLTARAGSGVVIARLDDGSWSPPSAIGLGGFGFGGQMGAEVTDFLIVLNSRAAVASFMSAGNLTLGGNLSVAVGPLGRNAEGSGSVNTKGHLAAMYSYSKTKGLFGGVSVEGSVIVERQDANRLAYGGNPNAKQILSGTFDPPEWAHVLIDQLEKSTGLPGGQTWIQDKDKHSEYGTGMSMGTPEKKGGGYVFGEGLGGGGNTPPTTQNGRRSRGNSLFGGQNQNDRSGNGSGSPSRPSSSRKGSSFNPFTTGSNSPRGARSPLEHSSETYSAGMGNGTLQGGRSRSGSLLKNGEVPQPFSYMSPSRSQQQASKEKDLLGDWDTPANANASDPFSTGSLNRLTAGRKPSAGEKDLLGTWESNGHNLSAQFASLKTLDTYGSTNGTRSRTGSQARKEDSQAFDDILKYPSNQKKDEVDYTPRETESKFANIDWSTYLSSTSSSSNGHGQKQSNFVSIASGNNKPNTSPTKKSRPFSMYGGGGDSSNGDKVSPNLGNGYGNKEFSPFEDLPVGRLRSNSNEDGSRPFESYLKYSNPKESPRNNTNGIDSNISQTKPDLRLKTGLENNGNFDGYARAIGLYDFITSTEGDLNFRNGQVIIILDKVDGSWWKGYSPISRKTGIFPSSYVEVVELPKNPKGGVGWGELRKRVGGNEFDQ